MSKNKKLFKITIDNIQSYCDGTSWERGQTYFEDDMIYDAYLLDDLLQAKCTGSWQSYYDVKVKLGNNTIKYYLCNCPRGDFCKHLVALTLTYIHDFDAINVIDLIKYKEMLQKENKEELINIILMLLKENPEIILDEFKMPGILKKPELKELDVLIEKYIKLADKCFIGNQENPYYAAFDAEKKLLVMYNKAIDYSESNKIKALALHTAIFESIDNNYNLIDDSNGGVGGQANECLDEIDEIFFNLDLDKNQRQKWLKRMFNRYVHNDYGIGDGVGPLILAVSDKEDIPFLQDLTIKALDQIPKKDDFHYSFLKKQLIKFLAVLYYDENKKEKALQLYLDKGLHFEYVKALINDKKYPEACSHAKQHLKKGYDIYNFVKILLELKLTDEAEDFIISIIPKINSNEPYYNDILNSLAGIYLKKKRYKDACDLYIKVFKNNPVLEKYKNLKKAGKKLPDWNNIDQGIIEFLKKSKEYEELIEIYLYKNQVKSALENLKNLQPYYSNNIKIKVAQASEKNYPQEAVKIYKDKIQRLIQLTGRNNYYFSVSFISKLKKLLHCNEFQKYLIQLKEENKRRPAFLDELSKGGY